MLNYKIANTLFRSDYILFHASCAHFCTSHLRWTHKCKFLIAGGGTGGISMAAKILRSGEKSVSIIEPSEVHYYQPYWTLVGGRKKSLDSSQRPTHSIIPSGAKWLKDKITSFDPSSNCVFTEDNGRVEYEYLIVALGIKLAFEKIKNLPEAFETPGVCSNYSVHTVLKTAEALKSFSGGNAIFTQPINPIKCAGAPQKIMYLAEEYFNKENKLNDSNIIFNTALPSIFSCPKYAKALEKVAKSKNITVNYFHNLIEVQPQSKEAVFEILDAKGLSTGKQTFKYEMLHVTPPMVAPPILKESPLSDSTGFMDVNKHTLQSVKFDNVYGIGDCTNAPTSKTAAAVAAQSGVVMKNLTLALQNKPPASEYFGYTSCPLVTGYNKGILAEFNYKLEAEETLPFDQSKERHLFYYVKKDALPLLYWSLMVKGLWSGPKRLKRLLHLGMKD